jgi:DNA (cytosine-5)-methyltransferase 1
MARTLLRRYTVAEFFCGCGGLSHGFWRTGRFRIVLGNDIKCEALRTFVLNHTENKVAPSALAGDIRKLLNADIIAKLSDRNVGRGELDCLIGGPPCQGFSQMRRSEQRKRGEIVRFKGYDRLAHDPRNDLVLRFLEIAGFLNPKVIVIENVPQMLRHGHNGVVGGLADSIKLLLREMGYRTVVDTVNAADYGLPQLRERAFFLASRVGDVSFPSITHVDPSAHEILRRNLPHWRTVHDAIGDLPLNPPNGSDLLGGGPCTNYRNAKPSEYARALRTSSHFPFNHVTRKYAERVLAIVREMKPGETWDDASERMQGKYDRIIERHQKPREGKSATLKRLAKEGMLNPVFFKRYYWSAYTRLRWDRPALTITANANFLGSGRFSHPERDRGITMREAARLQSFDDGFRFVTDPLDDDETTNIGIGLDMIGEAVPPLLGEVFAKEIVKVLDSHYAHHSAQHHEDEREATVALCQSSTLSA